MSPFLSIDTTNGHEKEKGFTRTGSLDKDRQAVQSSCNPS